MNRLEEMKDKLGQIRGVLSIVADQETVNLASELQQLIDEQANCTDDNYKIYANNLRIEHKKNEVYKQALEFYADEYNWHDVNVGSLYQPVYESDATRDGGKKARQALVNE